MFINFKPFRYSLYAFGGLAGVYGIAAVLDEEKHRRAQIQNGTWSKYRTQNTHKLESSWMSLRESQKTIYLMMLANVGVFVAWRVPALYGTMHKYFLLSHSSRPLSLALSMFSHQQIGHLLFNTLALYSFGTLLHEEMGREHFLAFYLSSGLASSLGSYLLRFWRNEPFASLGASGAIFGVVGALAHQPGINVSTIIFAFVSVPLDKALPCLVAFDMVGLLANWKTLDHAAHLAGAGFGYGFKNLSDQLWKKRRQILKGVYYPVGKK